MRQHKKGKDARKKRIIIIFVLVVLAIVFGFAGIEKEFIKEAWASMFLENTVEKSEDPVEEPSSDIPIEPMPAAPEEPENSTPKEEPSKYTIYVGQQLNIPVYANAESKVIESGTVSKSKQIALTFDAGWLYDQTLDLLSVLDDYQVKATFFLRGQWVKDHPDLAKEIAARGHSVQNHSMTHGHMRDMTDEAIIKEMSESTRIIEETIGARPHLFRPPFGEYDKRMLGILVQQGYPYTVKWTVDSLDWAEELRGTKITEQYLIDRVLGNASDNGIVLMHVGGYHTVKVLPKIIEGLEQMGYRLVKVNDMLPSTIPAEQNGMGS